MIVKFIYSEKATKFEKNSQHIWHYPVNVKITGRFFQNCVAFLEYLNFKEKKRHIIIIMKVPRDS